MIKNKGFFFVKSIRYNTLGKKDHFFLISRKNLEVENCENKPISRKIDHFGSFGSFGGLTERFGRTISADLTEKFGRNFGSGRTLMGTYTKCRDCRIFCHSDFT